MSKLLSIFKPESLLFLSTVITKKNQNHDEELNKAENQNAEYIIEKIQKDYHNITNPLLVIKSCRMNKKKTNLLSIEVLLIFNFSNVSDF